MDGEGIETLFFSLSSKSRIDILQSIACENLRMNEIARKNDITATEASRQIQRLLDERVIQKQPDGAYAMTRYGRLFLHFFPAYEFIFKHRDYFLVHDIWKIPPQFLSRLGELNQGSRCTQLAEVVNHIENMMCAATDFVWVITDQVMPSHGRVIQDKVSEGFKFRSLIPEQMIGHSLAKVSGKTVETKILPSIPLLMVLTEKEGFFALLALDGTLVHPGFFGSDPQFRGWLQDFFLYFWNQTNRTHRVTTQ